MSMSSASSIRAPSKKPLPGNYVPNNLSRFRQQREDLFPKQAGHNVTEESSKIHLDEGATPRNKLEFAKGADRGSRANAGGPNWIGKDGLHVKIGPTSGDVTGIDKFADGSSDRSRGSSAGNTLSYELLWTIGMNPDVPFLNLSNSQRDDICFVDQENLILYNLETNDFRVRNGHTNRILSLRRDRTGQHVLTMSEDQIIVWDTYLATPILSLHPVECSIFTDATISSNFQYIWAVTPHSLYVWNIPALRRNIQASFVYSLPRSIRGDIVEFLVDPHNDNNCVLICDEYEVHCFSVENHGNVNDQELIQYVPPYRKGTAGMFTCAALQEGTGIIFIGSQHGSILEWTDGDVEGFSNKKQFVREVKLPFASKYTKDVSQISVTNILCTKQLVLVGSSNAAIKLLTRRLKLLYWIESFGASAIRTMLLRRPERGSTDWDESEESSSNASRCLGGSDRVNYIAEKDLRTELLQRLDQSILPTSNISLNLTDSSNSNASPIFTDVEKHEFLLCREPGLEFTDSSLVPEDDIIVQTDQGDLICLDIQSGVSWTLLERKPYAIEHVCFHPHKTFMYVLYDQHTLEKMDFVQRTRLKKKRVSTWLDVGNDTNEDSEGMKVMCKMLGEKFKVKKKPTEFITTLQCVVKFKLNLLFIGLDSGGLCLLDGDNLTTLYRHVDSPIQSAITSSLFNEANTMFTAVRQNGYITVYDMLELTRFHTILYYQAHEKINDIIMDDASLTQVKIVSIGNDRMCHIRQITRTLDSNKPSTYDSSVHILRVEQFALPLIIRSFPRESFTADLLNPSLKPLDEDLYIIGNSEYKYRFYLKSSLKCVKTIQGVPLTSPLQQFRLLPTLNAAIITTANEITVQELPLTQLEHSSVHLTLHESTNRYFFVNDTEYVVSLAGNVRLDTHRLATDELGQDRVGENQSSLLVWKIFAGEIKSPARHLKFEHPLVPYYELIPGGYYGNEFDRLKDTFVYFTIQGECHNYISREICILDSKRLSVRNRINTCDLPFILSALDFYPSEFDLDNMMAEIELMNREELDFSHFLVLFLNHRPLRDVAFAYQEVRP